MNYASGMSHHCIITHLTFLSAVLFLVRPIFAVVHLNAKPFPFDFPHASACFCPPIDASGICGSLHVADPIYACSPIIPAVIPPVETQMKQGVMRFVLISRGECSFVEKVRLAQEARFDAAIIFDDRDKENLYSMIGDPSGIEIPSVFVSKRTGETLRNYSRGDYGECCIGPSIDEGAGTVLVMSFISLVVVVSGIASLVLAHNLWLLHQGTRSRRTSCLKKQTVQGLPCQTFHSLTNRKHQQESCAICLEDYSESDNLKILPCKHEFHVSCVDSWLTKWGTSCPICKHEVAAGHGASSEKNAVFYE